MAKILNDKLPNDRRNCKLSIWCIPLQPKKDNLYSKNLALFCFLFFGSLTLTKNFVSLLAIVVVTIDSIFKRNRYVLFGLEYGLYLLYQKIYFSGLQNVAYTSEIDFKDLFLIFYFG